MCRTVRQCLLLDPLARRIGGAGLKQIRFPQPDAQSGGSGQKGIPSSDFRIQESL